MVTPNRLLMEKFYVIKKTNYFLYPPLGELALSEAGILVFISNFLGNIFPYNYSFLGLFMAFFKKYPLNLILINSTL